MEIINYGGKIKDKAVLMLGFFDCLHIGHRKLLDEAKSTGFKTVIFTFSDNFLIKDRKLVFTYGERQEIFLHAGIDYALCADFDSEFRNLRAEDFLKKLKENMDLKAIVCGYDYRFGKDASGGTKTLRAFCENNGIVLKIIEKIDFEGEKASSTLVKKLLAEGNIKKAERLLEGTYFISGIVQTGRKIGRTLGYPTANISIDIKKSEIKDGVYKVYSIIDGSKYFGVANYGAKPTFGLGSKTLEVYYKDLDMDLYGREIKVYFVDFIRGIVKFDNTEQLKAQIKKDSER